MRELRRAFLITPALGFAAGALWSCGRWSSIWPQMSLALALHHGMIGWVVGVILAPLASRLRWDGDQRESLAWRRWGKVGMAAAAVGAIVPAGLWIAAAFPRGSVRQNVFPKRAADDHRPNLIFITIDALRWDHLGAYGSTKGLTPNLDAFAKEATVYTKAFASSPWTLTSFGSTLASRPPSEMGMKTGAIDSEEWYKRWAVWPDDVPLLSERLKAAGYTTGAVITNPFLRPSRGCSRGFDYFRNDSVEVMFGQESERAPRVTKHALQWLRLNRREPFFLWVHYLDPHTPYDAPTTPHELRAKYPKRWAATRGYWIGPIQNQDEKTKLRFEEFARSMYAEEVRYMDRWLGDLLKYLRAQDWYDDAMIVVSADHGEELFDHGWFEHGHSMHSEVLGVPLLVKWPRAFKADPVLDQTVGLVDVAPTFLRMAGVKDRKGMVGRILPRKKGEPSHEVYAEGLLYGNEQTALVTDRYKVIYHPWGDAHSDTPWFEVYDIRRDPGEHKNIADEKATEGLQARLKQRTERAQEDAKEWQAKLAQRQSQFRFSKEDERRLRALGYVK